MKSHVAPLAATTEPSGTEGTDQLYSDTHSWQTGTGVFEHETLL